MMAFFDTPFRRAWPCMAALWCMLAITLAWAGTLPDDYLIHVAGIKGPQPYPYGPVIAEIMIAGMVFANLAWALSGAGWRRIRRLLLGLIICAIVTVCALMGAMHAPRFHVYFSLALLFITVLVLMAEALLVIAGAVSLSRKERVQQ